MQMTVGAASPRDARSGKVKVLASRIFAGMKSTAVYAGKALTPRKSHHSELHPPISDDSAHEDGENEVQDATNEPDGERWASACGEMLMFRSRSMYVNVGDSVKSQEACGEARVDGENQVFSFQDPCSSMCVNHSGSLKSEDSRFDTDMMEECRVGSCHGLADSSEESVPEPFRTGRKVASWSDPWCDSASDSLQLSPCSSHRCDAVIEIQQQLPGSMLGEDADSSLVVKRLPAAVKAPQIHHVVPSIDHFARVTHPFALLSGAAEVDDFEAELEAADIDKDTVHDQLGDHSLDAAEPPAQMALNSLVIEPVVGSSPRRSLPARLPPLATSAATMSKKGRRMLASSGDLPTLLSGAPQVCDDLPQIIL